MNNFAAILFMLKEKLYELLEENILQIEELYPNVTADIDESVLLKIKIASLKLDVLFYVAESALKDHLHTYREIKNLRRIYIYTRKIRNIQNQRNLAHKYMLNHYFNLYEYVSYLDLKERKASDIYMQLWLDFDIKKLHKEKRLIEKVMHNYNDDEIEKIVNKLIKGLINNIYFYKAESKDIEWRKTRRRILVLKHALELANKLFPGDEQYLQQYQKTSGILQILDKWQQYHIAGKYFKAYFKTAQAKGKTLTDYITFETLLMQKEQLNQELIEKEIKEVFAL